MAEPRHGGVPIQIGGREWIVAPLNIRLLRRYLPRLAALGQAQGVGVTAEEISTLVEVIHAALARNYPNLSLAEVEEMLDVATMGTVFAAVCGASGLGATGLTHRSAAEQGSEGQLAGEGFAGDRTR